MTTQETELKSERYWWLAFNGASVASTFVPLATKLVVSPTPEQLIGYSTREEMLKVKQFLLTAPIDEVAAYMETLPPRIRAGEIQYQRPLNPEPPTQGQTMWHDLAPAGA